MIRVLVFGVFDGLHAGHDAMLREARSLGDELIVAVTQDSVVRQLKGKTPRANMEERAKQLRLHEAVSAVVLGDVEIGVWRILERVRPDLVACGYDQTAMRNSLSEYIKKNGLFVELSVLSPYKPDEFHSSLLSG